MSNRHIGRALLIAALSAIAALWLPAAAAAAELVMFDRADCPWCRKFDAEVAQGYVRSSEGQRAPLRRVDISKVAKSGVALAEPVRYTPTFVLAEGGREIGRITGYPGADFFWPQVNDLIAKLDAARR